MNFTSGFQSDILHIQFSTQAEKKMIKINISETPTKRQKGFRNLIPLVLLTLADWCILGTLKYCFIEVQ